MRYAQIREMDISNGPGVGISLFVQGCHFHCKGCFNQETWDFNGGKEWTPSIECKFLKLADKPYIKRISILGGEPLDDENVNEILALVKKIREVYPDKQIWVFTGYMLEDIVRGYRANTDNMWLRKLAVINSIDVLKDGQFELDKQDINHKQVLWAGSSNQRLIDVKTTFSSGQLTLYKS